MNIKKELEHIKRIYDFELTSEQVQALDIVIKSLDNEWVDVRDRLPNKTMSVLVTTEYTFQALYQSEEDAYTLDSGYFYITDEYGNYEKVENVIAWKPLPQPYERKEQV